MTVGVYLHIPFCRSRCSYCDFATDVYKNSEAVERYVNALCTEVRNFSATDHAEAGSPPDQRGELFVDTIYFGGGTPSLLDPEQVDEILQSIHHQLSVRSDAEITMEMNPATVTPETLQDYRRLGINRASFGVQTFNDRALKLLARGHDANDARQTFRMLRDAGFDNISFDLIAGLPNQTLAEWERNLDEAIRLSPEHLSLYLLEIHEGTPLAEQVRTGRQPTPDEDLAARMYEMMLDKLAATGYSQYEISNFSRLGFESRHNSKYWQLDPVYGFGLSAHSFDGHRRYSNERDTAKYIEKIETARCAEVMREEVDVASEFIFLGLRLNNGINLPEYRNRFGVDIEDRYRGEIDRFKEAGLLETSDGVLRLTKKGMLFSNEVFAVFV